MADQFSSFQEVSKSNTFYSATWFFFYYTTIFGFRPFALPGERCRIGRFSVIGILFSIPTLLLAGYFMQFMLRNTLSSAKILGFFSGQSVVMLALFLGFTQLFLYVLLSAVFATNLTNTITHLNSLTISKAAHFKFSIYAAVSFLTFLCLHIGISYEMIYSYRQILIDTRAPMGFWDNLTFFVMTYVVAVFLYPIMFLGLFVFFLGQVYAEQCKCLRDIPQRKIEYQLPTFYQSYMNLSKIVEEADDFFSYITFGIICVSLGNFANYILNIGNLSTIPPGLYASIEFLMLLNFFCYIILCTWFNDKSRAILADLHEIQPHNSHIHRWLEKFNSKIGDDGWGLTLGKFCLVRRSTFLELVNATVTYLALYGQFAPPDSSDSSDSNSTSSTGQSSSQLKQLSSDGSTNNKPPPGVL